MRLAVVSPFLDRLHGTELCIIEQIERLASQYRWEIHLYSQRVEDVKGLRPFASSAEDSPGSIFWHKVPEISGPHLFKYLWWFLANHVQRWLDRPLGRLRPGLTYSPGINCLDADVIVVHIVFHEFYARVSSELALRRVPLKSWPRIVHRKLYYKLIMSLEKKVYANSRVRLIAVSGLVAAQLKSHFRRSDVTVIPNAVDTLRFSPQARLARRETSRQAFGFSEKDFVLLLIGNDWKKKGLDVLLKALALLPDISWRLLVVGSDDPALYRPLLAQFSLSDHVLFEKPSPDVLRFYAAADLYAGPSLEDAFNLPILEAMACGVPVIASVQTGASEQLRHLETGLLLRDPGDAAELADLVQKLAADTALRSNMAEAASKCVQANCSWDQNVARTREFLEVAFRGKADAN